MVIKKLSKWAVKWAPIYVILLLTSTMAMAFQLESDDDHPFGIYFDDETPVTVQENQAKLEFLFQLPEKYYLYKDSVRVILDDDRLKVDVVLPDAVRKYDDFMGHEVDVYYNELAVPVTVTFPKDVTPQAELTGKISYQGCSTKICYRLMKQPFRFKMASAPEKVATPVATTQTPPANENAPKGLFESLSINNLDSVLKRGLGFTLMLTFLAGVMTGFTPCVLPVIPLTLAFMGVSSRQKKKSKVVSLLVFSLGLVVMYATLGVLSAVLGKTLGFWFQSLPFQIFLILFFSLMGLWMLGVINWAVPAGFQNAIVQYQPTGHKRQLYAGLTIGFLAAPCVGPVVGPLLVYITITKDVLMGTILMTSYAMGLSVLFFILAFFSRDWVARFGQKSNILKKALGALLLVTAGFYTFVLVNPYLANAGKQAEFFGKDYKEALKEASTQHKGILVDFYADWCLPCHEWDKEVWSDATVQQAISQNYVPVKIDCTKENKQCEEVVEQYEVIGWPTILFLDATQTEQKEKRLVGTVMDASEFLEYLKSIKK